MVADELVQLDQFAAVEPGGESLVQPGARHLGQTVVGGVSDQHMAEAKCVFAWKPRVVRANQLLAHERGETGRYLLLDVFQRLDRAAVEDLAFDRPALEHRSLGRLELVEPRGEQRLQRGRHRDLSFGLAGHRHHLRNEQWIATGSVDDQVALP